MAGLQKAIFKLEFGGLRRAFEGRIANEQEMDDCLPTQQACLVLYSQQVRAILGDTHYQYHWIKNSEVRGKSSSPMMNHLTC